MSRRRWLPILLCGLLVLLYVAMVEVRDRGSEVGATECRTRCTLEQEALAILGMYVLPLAIGVVGVAALQAYWRSNARQDQQRHSN